MSIVVQTGEPGRGRVNARCVNLDEDAPLKRTLMTLADLTLPGIYLPEVVAVLSSGLDELHQNTKNGVIVRNE